MRRVSFQSGCSVPRVAVGIGHILGSMQVHLTLCRNKYRGFLISEIGQQLDGEPAPPTDRRGSRVRLLGTGLRVWLEVGQRDAAARTSRGQSVWNSRESAERQYDSKAPLPAPSPFLAPSSPPVLFLFLTPTGSGPGENRLGGVSRLHACRSFPSPWSTWLRRDSGEWEETMIPQVETFHSPSQLRGSLASSWWR